jgi:hypothetical protein
MVWEPKGDKVLLVLASQWLAGTHTPFIHCPLHSLCYFQLPWIFREISLTSSERPKNTPCHQVSKLRCNFQSTSYKHSPHIHSQEYKSHPNRYLWNFNIQKLKIKKFSTRTRHECSSGYCSCSSWSTSSSCCAWSAYRKNSLLLPWQPTNQPVVGGGSTRYRGPPMYSWFVHS